MMHVRKNVISENWIGQWMEVQIRNTYPEHDEHWNYKINKYWRHFLEHKFPIEQLLSEFREQKEVFVWKKNSEKILIKQIIQLGINSGNSSKKWYEILILIFFIKIEVKM